MIKVAICDDEKNTRDYLSSLTKKQHFQSEIRTYASASDYLFAKESADILLLDIELKTKRGEPDGMELANEIRNTCCQQPIIIFITGYDSYVYDAFDVGAFQYLLKPVDEQKFSEVIERAVRQITEARERQSKTLVIRHNNMTHVILQKEILYIESRNHKVIIHTRDKTTEYYAKISDLEQRLGETFFRIHKSYLVNLLYVDAYTKNEVTLSNGEILFLSKYKSADFVKAHLRFVRQGGLDI